MMVEDRPPALGVKARLSAVLVIAGLAAATVPRSTAATLVVTNVNDSGPGSLRQAILDANATIGLDTITFQIPGTGVQTFVAASALPVITDPVVIDGTTQPGYAGTPLIELDGANAGINSSDGLNVTAGGSTILGLAINRFSGAGINLQTGGTNVVQGNFIGTDPTGTLSEANGWATTHRGGVWLNGSSANLVGGPSAANRNVISGNSGAGVYLQDCSGNTVQGNYIGTSASGTAGLGNTRSGIDSYLAVGNQIGGTSAGQRNIISGNGGSGVYLVGTSNQVQGNYIGTDSSGAVAIPNAGDGVTIDRAASNTIGGPAAGAGNLISGNSQGGIGLKNAGSDNNVVQGNLIGTDTSGRAALGNGFSGITIFGGNTNLIGGTAGGARNVISANNLSGIFITSGSAANVIQGNFIGVDATGGSALGNATNGVSVNSAGQNVIGGATAGAGNIISGNASDGIVIFGTGASGNLVQGNYIGTDVTGQTALANQINGVHIQSQGNMVGGTGAGAGNLISGNAQDGVFLDGAAAANNLLQGNRIGTTASGTTGLMNLHAGVGISGAPGNTIGGTAAGAGNLISANATASGDAGIYLIGAGATANVIQGNRLGTDITGTAGLGNTHEGIYLERAPSNTIGGTAPGAGNIISANKTRGIYLVSALGNVIQGNLIGTAGDGLSNLGNVYHGVECDVGSSSTVIGGAGNAANRIAYAQTIYAGVRIRDGCTNNAILGNAIFSNGALGIDLGAFGVNANVGCDAGVGTSANVAQNYPVLTQAVSGNATGVRGTLNSRPNQTFQLQFFANPACSSYGNGQGRFYLGQQTVVTGNDCNTSFVASLATPAPVGYVITATATDSANNTSEFSACVPVGLVPVLSSSAAGSQQLALAWTNTTTGFVLKQTGNLSPPIQWTTVTNSPVVTNGQFVVTVSTSGGNRFFALRFE